jgi:hypothetical protein
MNSSLFFSYLLLFSCSAKNNLPTGKKCKTKIEKSLLQKKAANKNQVQRKGKKNVMKRKRLFEE